MKRTVFLLLICLVATFSSRVLGQQIVAMDNAEAEFEGNWTVAKASPDRWKDDYKFSSTSASAKPEATATYKLNLPKAGKYSVEIWYPMGANRATDAKWLISYDGGSQVVKVNQQINGGQWVRIATDLLFAATGNFVQVQNNTGSSGSVVVADGIRLVPAGVASSATPAGTTQTSTSNTPDAGSSGKNYALTINAFGGTVKKSPDKISYAPNETVTLTAQANEGYVFGGWTEDPSTNTIFKNPFTIKMSENKKVTCNFIAGGIGLIVDNGDDGCKLDGRWQLSDSSYPGKRYSSYQFSSAKPKADSTATFVPAIPKTGRYDVYCWYPAGDNRTAAAPWIVSSKTGQVSTNINMRVDGGKWVLIAAGMPMDAGTKDKQYAQVSNGTGDAQGSGKVVVADAVAFVYVGD